VPDEVAGIGDRRPGGRDGLAAAPSGAGAYSLPSADTIAATAPYRDLTSGISQQVKTYIYATSASLESGKTVASVTLPTGSGGDIGIFAIGAG
jgi:hypothetical protein